jgi:hypothetical protein
MKFVILQPKRDASSDFHSARPVGILSDYIMIISSTFSLKGRVTFLARNCAIGNGQPLNSIVRVISS